MLATKCKCNLAGLSEIHHVSEEELLADKKSIEERKPLLSAGLEPDRGEI